MRFILCCALFLISVCPATAWSQRTSPSVRDAIRRGRLPGESSEQLRARLRMLEAMDQLNANGAESTPTTVRLGPKYRGGTGGMSALKEFYALQTLEIVQPGSQISDVGLAIVSNIKSVRAIRLEGVRLGDTSLTHVARLPNLQQFAVIDTGISDTAMRSFATVGSLEAVRISEKGFKGEGLRYLQRSKDLNTLQLEQSGVTDASLKYLDIFRSLKFLSVTDTEVSDEAVMKLWDSNPDLLIVGAAGGKAAKKGEPLGEPLAPNQTNPTRQATRPRIP